MCVHITLDFFSFQESSPDVYLEEDIELGSEETIPPVEDFKGTFAIKRRERKFNALTFYLSVLIKNDKYIKYITLLPL